MTNLTIDGETFKVAVEGDPAHPVLMLSNSLGTDLSMWDGQVPHLTRHFRVIRYDSRGHGGSVVDGKPGSLARLGNDALAILDALDVETVLFLGLSMGGAVGLWLMVNAPDRIDRVVLANTAARLGTPETWNARITSILSNGMVRNAAATIERWFTPDYAARAPDRVESIHAMLRATSPQGYACACAALRDMDLRAALHAIKHKVLVVTGRHDPVISKDDTNALLAGIAGARHVELAARHMSNIEAEADFNASVVAFLRERSRKSSAAAPRKSSAAKTIPVKRGGAGRRSNPARSPLTTAGSIGPTAKRTPAKTAPPRKGTAAKTAEPHRRPAAKRSAARPALKATSKRKPAKIATKPAPARRATPTTTARRPIKKAKPAKRGVAKAAAKKAPAKAAVKKLPGPRRKPTKKPRRPTGRRTT